MKTKSARYLPLVLLAVFLGCKPEKDDVFYLPPVPETAQKPFAPDSVTSYTPKLGAPGQALQYPFGTMTKPSNSIRLTELTSVYNKEQTKTIFQYDAAGRLSERTEHDKNGFILLKYSYRYEGTGKITVVVEMNKNNPSITYRPAQNSDLQHYSTVIFESLPNDPTVIQRTDEVDYGGYGMKVGTTLSRLGFGISGNLVRRDVLYRNGADETTTYSRIFKRDEVGNIVFIYSKSATQESLENFTYDDKPNPLQTTGDVMRLKDLAGEVTYLPYTNNISNANNVMSERIEVRDNYIEEIFHLYEYRSDGYPSGMKSFRRGELISTKEFKYNQ